MRTFIYLLVVFLLSEGTCLAQHSTTMRCGGRLVSLWDDKEDVEDVCGPPSFVDVLEEERTVKTYQRTPGQKISDQKTDAPAEPEDQNYQRITERTFVISIEEWTYNFGPSRFIQTLRFENSRLVSIQIGGYGFSKHPRNHPIVEKGDSKALVAMKYGPPEYTRRNYEQDVRINRRKDGNYLFVEELKKPIMKDEWVYDFGPNSFRQKLFFVNNALVEIRSLKKGKEQSD